MKNLVIVLSLFLGLGKAHALHYVFICQGREGGASIGYGVESGRVDEKEYYKRLYKRYIAESGCNESDVRMGGSGNESKWVSYGWTRVTPSSGKGFVIGEGRTQKEAEEDARQNFYNSSDYGGQPSKWSLESMHVNRNELVDSAALEKERRDNERRQAEQQRKLSENQDQDQTQAVFRMVLEQQLQEKITFTDKTPRKSAKVELLMHSALYETGLNAQFAADGTESSTTKSNQFKEYMAVLSLLIKFDQIKEVQIKDISQQLGQDFNLHLILTAVDKVYREVRPTDTVTKDGLTIQKDLKPCYALSELSLDTSLAQDLRQRFEELSKKCDVSLRYGRIADNKITDYLKRSAEYREVTKVSADQGVSVVDTARTFQLIKQLEMMVDLRKINSGAAR